MAISLDMLKQLISLLLLSSSPPLVASIFNEEDRKEYYQIKDISLKKLSLNSVALIPKVNMQRGDSTYKLKGKSLEEYFGFCPDTNFSKQLTNANCSGVLLNSDTILTAAHCIDLDQKSWLYYGNFNVVLDYKKTSLEHIVSEVSSSNVFAIKKVEVYEFSFDFDKMTDLAILKLDRNTDRAGVEVSFNYALGDKVFVLGYPLGIPMKLSNDSEIVQLRESINSFRHELDTFSVNSGSPIFNSSNELIGVHTRGTGGNSKSYGRECKEWWIGESGKDFGEANDLTPLKKYLSDL